MRSYPEQHEFTPLFVVGLPRAGTRFLADALNLSDEVSIQGEVYNPGVLGLRSMFERLDTVRRTPEKQARWQREKQHLTAAFWASASKSAAQPMPDGCRFYGFKTPQHERFFDFYEGVFADNPPHWVFCVRNFRDQFCSLAAMKWRSGRKATVDFIAAEYVRALDHLDTMQATAPERVHLFVLDDHVADTPGYLRRLLDDIGVRTDADLLERMAALGRRNSAQSKGLDLHTPTPEEESWIAGRADLHERFERLSVTGRD